MDKFKGSHKGAASVKSASVDIDSRSSIAEKNMASSSEGALAAMMKVRMDKGQISNARNKLAKIYILLLARLPPTLTPF